MAGIQTIQIQPTSLGGRNLCRASQMILRNLIFILRSLKPSKDVDQEAMLDMCLKEKCGWRKWR